MATFDELENSNYDGQPATLYLFQIGEVYWYYTSADRVISWPGPLGPNVDWLPVAISDEGTERGNADEEDFRVTVPSDLPLVALYRATAPSETMWLTVYRLHWPVPASAPVFWVGTITDVTRPKGTAHAELRGKPITASFERGGLRLAYSRNCPHFLYTPGCFVDKELHKFEGVVDQLTGNTFRLSTFAGDLDHFRGGFCLWERQAGLTERRGIVATSDGAPGIIVEVIGTTDGIADGTAMTIYKGCPHTAQACNDRFNNLPNYGGFEHLPAKSPFSGDPVF